MAANHFGEGVQAQIQELRAELNSDERNGVLMMWGQNLLAENNVRSDKILLQFLTSENMDRQQARNKIDSTLVWRNENHVEDGWDHNWRSYWTLSSFNGTYQLFVYFNQWLVFDRVTNDFRNSWRIAFERTIERVHLRFNGAPPVVLVVDCSPLFERSIHFTVNRVELFEAITESKLYYPNLISQEVYIGCLWERSLARWKGVNWTNAVSPEEAHKPLFKYLPIPLVHARFGGTPIDTPDGHSRRNGQVDVPHGKLRSIRIPIQQDTLIVFYVSVAGWNVSLKVEFVPLRRDIYPTMLFDKKLIDNDHLQANRLLRDFHAPVAGNIFVTVENSSFATKKVIVDCIVRFDVPAA